MAVLSIIRLCDGLARGTPDLGYIGNSLNPSRYLQKMPYLSHKSDAAIVQRCPLAFWSYSSAPLRFWFLKTNGQTTAAEVE